MAPRRPSGRSHAEQGGAGQVTMLSSWKREKEESPGARNSTATEGSNIQAGITKPSPRGMETILSTLVAIWEASIVLHCDLPQAATSTHRVITTRNKGLSIESHEHPAPSKNNHAAELHLLLSCYLVYPQSC